MKKILRHLLIACCLLAGIQFTGHAQFNSRYEYTLPGSTGFPIPFYSASQALDIVRSGNYSFCALIGVDSLRCPSGYRTRHIVLRNTDVNDWQIWLSHHYYDDTNYAIQPWRMVRADDGGYIVTGRAIDQHGISQPFASKFDTIGQHQWTRIYLSNAYQFEDSIRTSIVRVPDDTLESYFLVSAGANDNFSAADPQRVVTNITKIDGNGDMLWNKKYRNALSKPVHTREYPSAAIWVPKNKYGGDYCFIAGSGYDDNFSTTGNGSYYYVGIDRNGNMARAYIVISAPGNPYGHDAVYNAAGGRYPIALTWSLGNSGILKAQASGSNTQLGFMRLDDQLMPVFCKYYWTSPASQNEGVRIDASDSCYLIGANTYYYQTDRALSLLKVQPSGAPVFYHRFNAGVYSSGLALMDLKDPGSPMRWACLGGNTYAQSLTTPNTRLIVTDGAGEACGSESLSAVAVDQPLYPAASKYSPFEVYTYSGINLLPATPIEAEASCDPADPGHTVR